MTAARLPQAWAEVLDGLRTDGLPEGEPFPFDLSPLQAEAVACVGDRRGWEALTAFHTHREPLEVTAKRWDLPRERVRQLGLRALQQLAVQAHQRGWARRLHHLAQEPRAVTISPEVEEAWPVLALAALSRHTPDLRTVRLDTGLWVLFICPQWHLKPRGALDAARFSSETGAAQVLDVPPEVLRLAWSFPRLGVRRTRSGHYAPPEERWGAAAWLTAVAGALAQAGHAVWEERLLFAATRSLPGAPDVQDHTFRLALRKRPVFEPTEIRGVWRWAASLPGAEESPIDI